MNELPVTPDELFDMHPDKVKRLNKLLRNSYVPEVGSVQFNWHAVADAVGVSYAHPVEPVVAWIRRTYTQWTITTSKYVGERVPGLEARTEDYVRFERIRK